MELAPVRGTATIEEVAARAGVSRSTVSRVVNGSTAVSPAALEAVTLAQHAMSDRILPVVRHLCSAAS